VLNRVGEGLWGSLLSCAAVAYRREAG